MIVTRLGHATLLVETAAATVLVDPGSFSTAWHGLSGLDAILVSHLHVDHVDPERIVELLGEDRGPRLLVEPAVVEMFDEGIAEAIRPGDAIDFGRLRVEAVGGEHALLHESIPRVGNVGFVVTEDGGARLFHPGDSYATVPDDVDILALPLTAPWAKVGETIEFARAVGAPKMIPIHDAIVGELGRPVYMRICGSRLGDGVLVDPAVGEQYRV